MKMSKSICRGGRICTMCRNRKEMMHMFSEELSILDKNTVMMMIEEQQEAIEQQKQELSQKDETIGLQKQEIKRLCMDLEEARHNYQ